MAADATQYNIVPSTRSRHSVAIRTILKTSLKIAIQICLFFVLGNEGGTGGAARAVISGLCRHQPLLPPPRRKLQISGKRPHPPAPALQWR